MKPQSIAGRDALTGQSILITMDNGCIQRIDAGPPEPAIWISPGFVDLQVNGYGGCDLNADTVDCDVVIELVARMMATGTTRFVPTIITASTEKIIMALKAVAQARRASALAAHAIPYVHLEGPYISPEKGARGAHPCGDVRRPNCAEFEQWQAESGNLVGMITVSPHWDNALEFIDFAARRGVLVAIGHTHATAERLHAAAAAGAVLSTHLGNGIATLLPRHPNPIWAQLADDRLTATFIADGHHLPADTLKTMLRAKGIDRSILVSDSVALGGMPPGTYRTAIGGQVELSANGRLCIANKEILAGSALPLRDGIARAVSSRTCALSEAIRMVTENPGRFVGEQRVLRPGAKSDLVSFTFDPEAISLQLERVLVGGQELQ